jgi:hypothetical protein
MLRKRRFFQVSAMALLSVCASCQTTGHKPLLSEAVIAAAAIYESPEDRQLVLKHQDSLNAIFQGIRKRFRPSKLEFFLISGICFRKLQIKNRNDTYLSINTRSSTTFKDGKTSFEKRAASVFAEYSKPLLAIAASEKALLEDEDVAGIMIGTRWGVQKNIKDKYRYVTHEEMILVVRKQEIHEFVNNALTDQQLLDRSTVIALSESESPREITLTLE